MFYVFTREVLSGHMCACFILFEISVVLSFRVFCTSEKRVALDAFSSNDVIDGQVRIKQCILASM